MKNITYATFAWDNNGFFIIFEIIFALDNLRPYEKWVFPIFISFIAITAACSDLCYIFDFNPLHPIRTVLLH